MELVAAPAGLWMTYRSDATNGWGPKQCALLDAIASLSALTQSEWPDASTTAELAGLVGCSVDEAWFALVLTDYAIAHWPTGQCSRSISSMLAHRGLVLWSLPELTDIDDETWYGWRIEEAERLGQPGAAEFWRRELEEAQGQE